MSLKGKTPKQHLWEKLQNHVSNQTRNTALPLGKAVQKVG